MSIAIKVIGVVLLWIGIFSLFIWLAPTHYSGYLTFDTREEYYEFSKAYGEGDLGDGIEVTVMDSTYPITVIVRYMNLPKDSIYSEPSDSFQISSSALEGYVLAVMMATLIAVAGAFIINEMGT